MIYDRIETFKDKACERLTAFYWGCQKWLVWLEYTNRDGVFMIALPVWAISLIIAGASFGAQLGISALLAPKAKPQVRGKLTGELTLTDSILGAPIPRIYGGRDTDGTPGGVEAGCNIQWMSDIRKIQTQTPGGGGGGKGGPKSPPNIQINYKVDLDGIVGAGPLRLLRMKWNEDTVYSIIGGGTGGGGTPVTTRIEAEDGGNDLSGGATVTTDLDCSNDEKVTGIGLGGVLVFNVVNPSSAIPIDPDDPPMIAHFSFDIRYKATGDKFCYVKLNGDGELYSFPDTGGSIGIKNIIRVRTGTDFTLEFSNPGEAGPDIDCLDWTVVMLTEQTPTGLRNEDFPVEPDQDNIFLPDPYATNTQAGERYNAATPEVVDGYMEIPLQNGASMAWYEGTEDQPIDSVIEANVTSIYGAGSTPAFLGICHFRINNMDITDYGSVPAIRVVVENTELQKVSEILINEAMLVGLDETDLDLDVAEDMHCRGLWAFENDSPSKFFETVSVIHNLAFPENHDGKVFAVDLNDRTPVASIERRHLGAYDGGDSDEVPLDDVVTTIPDESEDLIGVLELSYNNPLQPSDYATDRRAFNFPFTRSKRKETRSLNATLLPEESTAIVSREMQKHHLQQAPDAFVTTHEFIWVNAAECIELEIDGKTVIRRVAEKNGSAPGTVEMTVLNEDAIVMADNFEYIEERIEVQGTKPVRSKTNYPANTVGTIMDLPPLLDEHKGVPGVYVASCSRGSGAWKGCQVYRLRGAGYEAVSALTKEAGIGIVVDEVPDPPSYSELVDPSSVITVDFFGSYNPTTVTDDQFYDGANSCCIGSEVARVKQWTRDTDYPNRWIGETIYRGDRNTLDRSSLHTAGERFVVLDDAVKFVPLDNTEFGIERSWRFVTYGGQLDDSSQIMFTWERKNLFQNADSFVAKADDNLTIRSILTVLDGGSGVPSIDFAIASNTDRPAEAFTATDITKNDSGVVYQHGYITGLSGLTPGATYFLSDTAGEITATAPTSSGYLRQVVGIAINETTLHFKPEKPVILR